MRGYNKPFLAVCVFLILSLVLSSCGTEPTGAEIVTALLEAEPSPPAGELYQYPATDTEKILTEEMCAAMFGNGSLPPALDEADSITCYLAPTHPFQIILFHAKTHDGAQNLAQICLQRKDAIIRYWQNDSAILSYLENATVTVCGKWVMLAVAKDPDTLTRILRRLV